MPRRSDGEFTATVRSAMRRYRRGTWSAQQHAWWARQFDAMRFDIKSALGYASEAWVEAVDAAAEPELPDSPPKEVR